MDGCKRVTVYEASHIDAVTIDKMLRSYPEREIDMRMHGIPMLGAGAVYLAQEKDIQYNNETLQIPAHFKRICAVDFGFKHPAAIVWSAICPDTKKIYVYDCWKASGKTIGDMSSVLIGRGNIPVIFPHDGDNETQGAAGESMAKQLRDHGVNVLRKFENAPDVNGKTNNQESTLIHSLSDIAQTR